MAQVERLDMTKGETENIVKEVWAGKEAHDANKRHCISLGEYLAVFLAKRHGANAIKMGYNLVYHCHKHKYDPDLDVFLQVQHRAALALHC